MKKLVHLLRTCKARFIDNKEPFLSISGCFVPNEMALERATPFRMKRRKQSWQRRDTVFMPAVRWSR
jgi:hypothetical protein